jgi:hypothetical protein
MARTVGAYNMVIRKGNDGRVQAWQSMRIMRRFTRDDILTTTPQIKRSNLVKFTKGLIDVGIVRVRNERLSGSPGSKEQLELVVDKGPKPPVLWKNGQVYEPNEEMVYGEPKNGGEHN